MSDGGRGTLFVLSAPSGTGKSTLARAVLAAVEGLEFSISYTTRARRDGEIDGREYHFVDDARFDAMAGAGGFLEWAHVFGRRYGTGRAETESKLASGTDLLLDIDVQGARQIRLAGFDAVFAFVLPPDFDVLASRLRSRASDTADAVERRLRLARSEAEEYVHYDFTVVNDDLASASAELVSIVRATRARTARRSETARRILTTFPPAGSGGQGVPHVQDPRESRQ